MHILHAVSPRFPAYRGTLELTLYQCFFTLPSVRVGNDYDVSVEVLDAVFSVTIYLCYLSPALIRISHDSESLLLRWTPRCVGPVLLGRGRGRRYGFFRVFLCLGLPNST